MQFLVPGFLGFGHMQCSLQQQEASISYGLCAMGFSGCDSRYPSKLAPQCMAVCGYLQAVAAGGGLWELLLLQTAWCRTRDLLGEGNGKRETPSSK
jgi:hypothetical protein